MEGKFNGGRDPLHATHPKTNGSDFLIISGLESPMPQCSSLNKAIWEFQT